MTHSVAIVCVTVLGGLVMLFRHLASMRVTDGEAAELRQWVASVLAEKTETIREHEKKLVEHQERLVAIDNRTRK